MGASASAFATIKRPAFTASAGLVWMWRPDVVMSNAADSSADGGNSAGRCRDGV